jgi:very-short-patch-repair endonuclease
MSPMVSARREREVTDFESFGNRGRRRPKGGGVTRTRTRTARVLRRHETDAERVLWELLRGRKLLGLKFRRQAPIGHFVVDFLCHDRALVVEADGPIHFDRIEYDGEREAWLTRRGFTVVRFSNAEILSEPGAVQRRILLALSRLAGEGRGEGML